MRTTIGSPDGSGGGGCPEAAVAPAVRNGRPVGWSHGRHGPVTGLFVDVWHERGAALQDCDNVSKAADRSRVQAPSCPTI